jgi:hypothetical protein
MSNTKNLISGKGFRHEKLLKIHAIDLILVNSIKLT